MEKQEVKCMQAFKNSVGKDAEIDIVANDKASYDILRGRENIRLLSTLKHSEYGTVHRITELKILKLGESTMDFEARTMTVFGTTGHMAQTEETFIDEYRKGSVDFEDVRVARETRVAQLMSKIHMHADMNALEDSAGWVPMWDATEPFQLDHVIGGEENVYKQLFNDIGQVRTVYETLAERVKNNDVANAYPEYMAMLKVIDRVKQFVHDDEILGMTITVIGD